MTYQFYCTIIVYVNDCAVEPCYDRRVATDLRDDLSFLLARANALSVAAGNQAMAAHGLKVRSYSVLAMAVNGIHPSQREMAAFLRLDPSQVVALVDDLQSRGLVERQPDPNDRRANVVSATAAGRALFAAAEASARAAERTLHADLAEAERSQLLVLLRRLAQVP